MTARWLYLGPLIPAIALLLPALPLSAAEPGPNRCGFSSEALRVTDMTAGVPLLLAPTGIPDSRRARVTSRRANLIDGKRACAVRHPHTMRYLRSILDRLLEGSRLQGFAGSDPNIELVLTCSRAIPLPVARAAPGKILIVPRALPARAGSEDAIAAVLGHELAHLTLRHPEQFIGATAGPTPLPRDEALALKSSHEREADITGLRLAVNAGYDAHAAVDHLRLVADLAAELERSGHSRRRRRAAVHDGLEVRTRRLQSQIEACGYSRAPARTPIAPAVVAELAKAAKSGAAAGLLDNLDPTLADRTAR